MRKKNRFLKKYLYIILLGACLSKVEGDNRIYDIIIIGAGISGLSAADHLADAGKDILVLES